MYSLFLTSCDDKVQMKNISYFIKRKQKNIVMMFVWKKALMEQNHYLKIKL